MHSTMMSRAACTGAVLEQYWSCFPAVDDDVAALLRMNLRNSHTVRDASVLYYKPRATMAIEIQPLHTNSALGRELETIDVNQSGGRPSHRTDILLGT